jgi:hypothetical protein
VNQTIDVPSYRSFVDCVESAQVTWKKKQNILCGSTVSIAGVQEFFWVMMDRVYLHNGLAAVFLFGPKRRGIHLYSLECDRSLEVWSDLFENNLPKIFGVTVAVSCVLLSRTESVRPE